MVQDYARIVDFAQFEALRPELGRIVCTSGGFDPIHPGHASCLIESARHGDTLAVIVNGDSFLRRKKGKPFQDLRTRCQIVASVRRVDFVVPYETDEEDSVCGALRRLRPHVFTKGGDRTGDGNTPESALCRELGIEIVYGVGADKAWSSSDFLAEWGAFWVARRDRG